MPQLPHSVELHDSMLAAIRKTPEGLTLELRPSYMHRDGNGWRQDADIHLVGAHQLQVTPVLPARIADGDLRAPAGPYHNLLMLPLQQEGNVQLKLELENGDFIELHGSAVSIRMLGEPVFVERFP